jgi:hypothetical protein
MGVVAVWEIHCDHCGETKHRDLALFPTLRDAAEHMRAAYGWDIAADGSDATCPVCWACYKGDCAHG